MSTISIHALREEGDAEGKRQWQLFGNFYPRPPRGGRQYKVQDYKDAIQFLSTPSARRATRCSFHLRMYAGNFYPRPPRGGRRAKAISTLCGVSNFYPRPPRGGRRWDCAQKQPKEEFLSTPSARRATNPVNGSDTLLSHFYPRPPRGGRRVSYWSRRPGYYYFYPRPPRGGRPKAQNLEVNPL